MEIPLCDPRLVLRLRRCSRAASAFAVATGVAVLIGWMLNIPALKSLLPGLSTMKANTAMGILFFGVSLWLAGAGEREGKWSRPFRAGSMASALIALGVGLATWAEHMFHANFGIDELLFMDRSRDGHSVAGRMGPNTAACIVLIACALLLNRVETKNGVRPAQLVALVPAGISLFALMGYLFSVVSLYRFASYTGMALHTAAVIQALSLAICLSPPDRGIASLITSTSLGGVVVRRLLPVVVIVPIVIGWLRMEGQRAGLYGTEFGLALMVTTSAAIFSMVTYFCGAGIRRAAIAEREAEFERLRATANFFDLHDLFGSVVEACPLAIIGLDGDGHVQLWSRAAEQMFGWASLQLRGRANPVIGKASETEYRAVLEKVRNGESVQGIEMECVTRDDERVHVALRAAPIAGVKGRCTGCVLVMEDLSTRKLLEGQLRSVLAENSRR